ncbi:hypothetical protein VNO77_21583 [Canavalia gladiata]|uniref:RRM domain-containing protein n=1 Tax=Canavalia gladiata TaxID=3824 RepID=A0AAN9LW30_CANGL
MNWQKGEGDRDGDGKKTNQLAGGTTPFAETELAIMMTDRTKQRSNGGCFTRPRSLDTCPNMEEFDKVWRTQQHQCSFTPQKPLPFFFSHTSPPQKPLPYIQILGNAYTSENPTTMAGGIDMSLDDLIKRSAAASSSRRSHGPGPDRRFMVPRPDRTTPYSIPQARQVWQRSTVPEMVLGDESEAKTDNGTKLYISNLDYRVSNDDIKLLFSEEGELKRYSIHYDKSGRSKGTAEVIFTRQSDALAAIKKYNNMRLDGKPLQIELVGTSLVTPAVMPLGQNSLLGRPNDDVLLRVGGSRIHNGFGQGRLPKGHRDLGHNLERYHCIPRGNTKVKGHIGKMTVKDLDDDLERYHLEAKQINNKKYEEVTS